MRGNVTSVCTKTGGKVKRKRPPKHRDNFITKAELRAQLANAQTVARNAKIWAQSTADTANRLRHEVSHLTQKVLADAFLIDELKNQVSQQHIQMCIDREIHLERKDPGTIIGTPRGGPGSPVPERAAGPGPAQ
jgi:hypothetical protein